MAIVHLTKDNFDKEVLKSKDVVVVDYWASWCGPCRMMAPVFEALSSELKGIKFAKLSTEDAPEIAERFEIMSIPTLILYKDGKEIDRMIGALPHDYMKGWLEKKR